MGIVTAALERCAAGGNNAAIGAVDPVRRENGFPIGCMSADARGAGAGGDWGREVDGGFRPAVGCQPHRHEGPLLGQFCRWVEASLAAGMNASPVIDQKFGPNGSFPYRRIHTPDPEPTFVFRKSGLSMFKVSKVHLRE